MFKFFWGGDGHYLSSVSVQTHCKIVSEHLFLVIPSVLFLIQMFELPFCSCFNFGLIAACLFAIGNGTDSCGFIFIFGPR